MMHIANRELLQQILSRVSGFEYKRKLKPALSQVHADLSSKEAYIATDYRDALNSISDHSLRLLVNRILRAIDVMNFVSVPIGEAMAGLDQAYGGEEVAPEAPPVIEEPKERAPIPTFDFGEEEIEEQEVSEDQRRLEEIRQRYQEASKLEIPAWRKDRAKLLLSNTRTMLSNIEKYIIPNEGDITDSLDHIDGWLNEVYKFMDETEPPAEAPVEAKPKKRRVRIVPPHQSVLDEDDESNMQESGQDKSVVDDPTAIAQSGLFADTEGFILIREDGMPIINHEAISAAYAEIKDKLSQINEEYKTTIQSNQRAKAGPIRKKLNMVFHAIKAKDWETKTFFTDHVDEFREAMDDSQAFEKFRRELYKAYLSSKLTDDGSLFNEMYWALAFCVSYALHGHILGIKPLKYSSKYYRDESKVDMDLLRERYLTFAAESIRSKFFRTFQISAPAFYRTRFDTIKELEVNTATMLVRVDRALYGGQEAGQRVYFRTSFCPVCFKEIRWTRPEAYRERDEYKEFEVPVILPYNVDTGTPITEEALFAAGHFEPPAGGMYHGSKTWEQIKELLASNDVNFHREGWHRRAAAIKQLGGTDVGETNISNIMFRCPYPTDKSSCGISLSPMIDRESFLPPMPDQNESVEEKLAYIRMAAESDSQTVAAETFQKAKVMLESIPEESFRSPQERRELIHRLTIAAKSAPEKTEYAGLVQPRWSASSQSPTNSSYEDRIKNAEPHLRDHMRTYVSGGYKFSNSLFRCPCRISPDAAKKGLSGRHVSNFHFTYAIPYAGIYQKGSAGHILPTNSTGEISEDVPEGSFGYLVCGAQTSLSSFDRDPDNSSGFISMMKDVHASNPTLFLALIEYFLKEGVDVSDVMSVMPYIFGGETSTAPKTAEFSRIRSRINKLSRLIVEGMARKGDQLFDNLKEFMLVCPFGHRFRIKDSLAFGSSHLSMSLRKTKMLPYKDMINGKVTSWDLMISNGDLVKIEENVGRNYFYYDEWILKDADKRKVNLFGIQSSLAQLSGDEYIRTLGSFAFLKFKGPDGDYALRDSLRVSAQAWTDIGSAKPIYSGREYAVGALGEISAARESARPEDRSATLSEAKWAKDYRASEAAAEETPALPIPGSESLADDVDFEEYCDSKRASLARALKAVLSIVAVWNNGIVNEQMARIFIVEKTHEVDLVPIASGALEAIQQVEGAVPVEDYVSSGTDVLRDIIEKNIETYGIIKPSDTSKDIATNILADAIAQFVLGNELGQRIVPAAGKIRFERRLRKAAEQHATSVLSGNGALISYLSSSEYRGQTIKRKSGQERYIIRMFLLAFSSYLSHALAGFARDYLAPESERYVGYNVGVDLTDPNFIMNITSEMMEDIGMALEDAADEPLDDYSYYGNEQRDETDVIDKAYQRIVLIINWANRLALTPQNIERAKAFVGERLGQATDRTSQWIVSQLDKFFPVANLPLTHDKNIVWINRRVPITGRTRQITDMPDTRYVGKNRVVNPSINFDSSRLQVGMISPRQETKKVGKRQVRLNHWPASAQGYGDGGFVGVTVPARKATAQNTPASQIEFKVLDYSVSVDIGGEPVDISFLFQRGFSEEDLIALNRIEGLIEEAEIMYSRALDRLESELSGEEYEVQAAKLHDAHRARLTELRSRRGEIPLRFKTNTNSFMMDLNRLPDYTDFPFLQLEDFQRTYAVLSKRTYAGYPAHRNAQVGPIVTKVLSLYKAYAKTGDADIREQIRELTYRLHAYQLERDSTEICLTITDPHNAYRLINSPALTGMEFDEDTKEKLIEFIMDVYGGWRVKDVAERLMGREVNIDEILTMIKPDGTAWEDSEIAELNKLLRVEDPGDVRGWINHIGMYYDVFEGDDEDADIGSYIQYVYGLYEEGELRPPVGGIPNVAQLTKLKRGGTAYGIVTRKTEGGRGRKTSPEKVAKYMANRARAAMLRYIDNVTSGVTTYDPTARGEASEGEVESKIIDKIAKRRKTVSGIIIESGILSLLPDVLVEEAIKADIYDYITN
nr:hypothetical protein 27 [bacterium]